MQQLAPTDPGQVGPYRIIALLGSGGMGRVYLGLDQSGGPAAVKVVRAEYAYDPDFRERFARELELAQRVHGHYTPRVLAADTSVQSPWLATEYVMGPSLHDLVQQTGPLPEGAARFIGRGVAQALERVHQSGLVHRDLKPGNVMVSGGGPQVIDFGIARAMEEARHGEEDSLIGTPGYMAPENMRGEETGPAADVFALGGVLVYALTGAGPFGDGHPSAVLYRITNLDPDLTGVPASLRPLVAACLDKDPARRPAAAQVLHALGGPCAPAPAAAAWLPPPAAAVIDGIGHEYRAAVHSVPAAHDGGGQQRGSKRNRRLLALGAVGAALVLLASIGTLAAVGLLNGDGEDAAGPGDHEQCDVTEDIAAEYTEAAVDPPRQPSEGWTMLQFSPDGQALVVSGTEGTVLWDWEDGVELARLSEAEVSLMDSTPEVSPDGCRLGYADEDGAHVYHLDSGEHTIYREGFEISAMNFAADGQNLFLVEGEQGSDSSVLMVDLESSEVTGSFDEAESVHSLALSPEGGYLGAVTYLDELVVWEVDTGEVLYEAEVEMSQTGSNFQIFDEEGGLLYTDGEEVVYENFLTGDSRAFAPESMPEEGLGEVAVSPEDDLVFATYMPEEVVSEDDDEYGMKVWEFSSTEELSAEEDEAFLSELSVHPDGGVIAGIPFGNTPVWLVETDTMQLHSRIG